MAKKMTRETLAKKTGAAPMGREVRHLVGPMYLVRYTASLWGVCYGRKAYAGDIATFATEPSQKEIDAAIDHWIAEQNWAAERRAA
jgi:hypothetical protein